MMKTKQRKSFIREENLNEHIKMSHTLPEVKCKECGLKMKNKWTLSRHMKSTHEENKEVNKCGSCGKTFGRKDNLMKHIQHYHWTENKYIKKDYFLLSKGWFQSKQLFRSGTFPIANYTNWMTWLEWVVCIAWYWYSIFKHHSEVVVILSSSKNAFVKFLSRTILFLSSTRLTHIVIKKGQK